MSDREWDAFLVGCKVGCMVTLIVVAVVVLLAGN